MIWDGLEDESLDPLFYVEKPDGLKHLGETARVIAFRDLVRTCTKGVKVHAIPNAAKRSRWAAQQAKREGLVAGVFDLCITWATARAAWCEFKGYDASGKAGRLSDDQIRWGNDHFMMGHAVGCFFSPERALQWLGEQGAPVIGRVAA